MSDPNTALARPVGDANNLKALLASMQQSMQAVIPKHLTPERMVKITLIAASRVPKLFDCSKESILQSVMRAAEAGLEPDGEYGALVPFFNGKTKRMEAQFMPMFKGLIKKARNTGELSTIEAHVVRENDEWKLEFGLEPKLSHTPTVGKKDPGDMLFAYALAKMKDGTKQYEVMTRAQIEHVKASSKAKDRDDSPWKNHEEEMWKKTVLKRLLKVLPSNSEMDAAIRADNEIDMEIPIDAPALLPDNPPPQAPPADNSEAERRSKILTKLQERTRALGVNLRGAEWDGCKQARWGISKLADMTIDQASEWDALIGDVEQGRMTLGAFLDPTKARSVSQDLLEQAPQVFGDDEPEPEQTTLFDGEEMDV